MPGKPKKEVFRKSYQCFAQDVFRYAFFLCGDKKLAEDIMQDSFVRYWDHCVKIETGKEKTYLFRIAKNLYINHREHQQVVMKFERRQTSKHEQNTPQFQLEQSEFQQRLDQAISSLTPGQREVFLLNRIEGLKYREIAELLGISQKAVEKRMSLALQELRKIHDKI